MYVYVAVKKVSNIQLGSELQLKNKARSIDWMSLNKLKNQPLP